MTKRNVSTNGHSANNGAENPQIRRAAERRNGESNGHADGSVPSGQPNPQFHRRVAYERAERNATALSRLVTGGLYVSDDEGSGCTAQDAIMKVAGAVTKSVMLAQGTYTDQHVGLDAAQDSISEDETIAALSLVVALLESGPRVLEALHESGQWRDSLNRWERREEFGETEEVFAAEGGAS